MLQTIYKAAIKYLITGVSSLVFLAGKPGYCAESCSPIVLEQRLESPVQSAMKSLVRNRKSDLETSLTKLTMYEDYFRSASLATGVDLHLLKAIAVKESSGHNLLISPAGAAGLMQLMPSIAREYGLIIDDFVDERLSPASVTAAASYISYLMDKYDNTAIAVLAYHDGETKIDKLLRTAPSGYVAKASAVTRDFAHKVLAITTILHDMDSHGLSVESLPLYSVELSNSRIHTVKKGQNLGTISWIHNTSKEDIKALNPQILTYAPGMKVHIPRT